jgi:hypothetical protein
MVDAPISSTDQGGEKLAGHNSRAANSEVANRRFLRLKSRMAGYARISGRLC